MYLASTLVGICEWLPVPFGLDAFCFPFGPDESLAIIQVLFPKTLGDGFSLPRRVVKQSSILHFQGVTSLASLPLRSLASRSTCLGS